MKKINEAKPSAFVKIANYAFKTEAEMAVATLKKAGIPSFLQSSESAYSPHSPTGFSLLVPEKDVKRALNIIPYRGD